MTSLKTPELILSSADALPFAIAPAPDLFQRRAARFDSLATGHPMGDGLHFLAELSRVQHSAGRLFAQPANPQAGAPLDAAAFIRGALWRDILSLHLDVLHPIAPAPTRSLIEALRAHSADQLDALAQAMLAGQLRADEIGYQPLLSAALQVLLSAQAAAGDASALQPAADRDLCPCCGTPAVAAVVRIGGNLAGLRYLHCPLCNTEWNVMRARCTSCESDQEVAQHRLQDHLERPWLATAAESCEVCASYRKVFYLDKDPHADPIADDLATLALDVMMGEAGYARSGANPFLVS